MFEFTRDEHEATVEDEANRERLRAAKREWKRLVSLRWRVHVAAVIVGAPAILLARSEIAPGTRGTIVAVLATIACTLLLVLGRLLWREVRTRQLAERLDVLVHRASGSRR